MAEEIDSPLTAPNRAKLTWKGFILRAAVIFFVALFVYIPAMQAKWIWDDNLLITQYLVMQHKDGLRIFWFSSLLSPAAPWLEEHFPWVLEKFPWIKEDAALADTVPDYYPITWTTLWLEWRWWGDYPPAYHASNCVMHALSAVLVWLVLRKLAIPGAFLAGLIFAVHPVNVCSVAWVSERKNTLSIIFFLLTLLFYFGYENKRRWWQYTLALLMFVLALLSKASMVTLPLVLLLAAWWRRAGGRTSPRRWVDRLVDRCLRFVAPLGRVRPVTASLKGLGRVPGLRRVGRWLREFGWRDFLADLVRVAPFFLLAIACSKLVVYFQTEHVIRKEPLYEAGEGTLWWRLAMAGAVPWFYLYKALLPFNLLMIYPRWDIDTDLAQWFLPGVVLIVSAVVLLYFRRRAWARHLIFALGYFLVLLFPVMGFFDMYFYVHSLVADHWQYLSIIGVIALVVGGGTWAFRRQGPTGRQIGVAVGTVLVIVLGVLTWNQTLVYDNQVTLWRYNLSEDRNPNAWMGQYNLGTTLAETVQDERDPNKRREIYEEALDHLLKATELRPNDDAARNNAGLVLLNLGRIDEAIHYLRQAFELSKLRNDVNPQAAMNLSLAYRTKGDMDAALYWGQVAVDAQPFPRPGVHLTYAETLQAAGKPRQALAHLTKAVEANPGHVEAWYQRGRMLKALGRVDEALANFEHALKLQPNAVPVKLQVGIIAQERGQIDKAINMYTETLLDAPGHEEARYRLGLLLLGTGRPRQALPHLSLVVRANPSNAEARGNLAVALTRSGHFAQAIAEYRTVLEAEPNWVQSRCDLARLLAHPRSGPHRDLGQAIALAEEACQMSDYKLPMALESLAMVYSEAGRFDEAVKVERQALELLDPSDEVSVNVARERLQRYQSHQPYSAVEVIP